MFSGLNSFPIEIKKNIAVSWSQPGRSAEYADFPDSIPHELISTLSSAGIKKLYKHQASCIESIQTGKHIIISTGTSSGKSLCYQIPILSSILTDPNATALLLFPTKALSADQQRAFSDILETTKSQNLSDIRIGVYDGDTCTNRRIAIRNSANIIITNPDMLHVGMMPHHPSWERLFSNLKFIVIDEAHVYSGVFGAHFANLLRRLKRICFHYQKYPQFLLSSATIADPENFAQTLIEEKVDVFSVDHSPKRKRTFAFYNPPIVDHELGIRKAMVEESIAICRFLLSQDLQIIAFARSRVTVEMIFRKINALISINENKIAPYRSGYTKSQRREIEKSLKNGTISLVISTIALELGIDMGMVDVILMNGYPGSITRFLQQAGRAGRRNKESYCLMVASSLPIDQFMIHHPEYIRDKMPEVIYIDANNPYILFNHIRCAAFELPFIEESGFGSLSHRVIGPYLEIMEGINTIILDNGKYFWAADDYPASAISLRSIGGHPFQLSVDWENKQQIIGEIDAANAKKFVHPGAIYLHLGDPYLVKELDQEKSIAKLSPSFDSIFYTKPLIDVKTEIIRVDSEKNDANMIKGYGEVKVSELIKGFSRYLWDSQAEISRETLALAPDILETKGGWLLFPEKIINLMSENNLWSINRVDYGPNWNTIRQKILSRDEFRCQLCNQVKAGIELHVHHKKPVRLYVDIADAHTESNLITLCKTCHKIAEKNLRIASTLSGFGYGLLNITPVFIKCSQRDIGITFDMKIGIANKLPGVIFYDQFPGGIGLSAMIYERMNPILEALYDHILLCICRDGCPSCVGPGGENGYGSKAGVQKLLALLLERSANE